VLAKFLASCHLQALDFTSTSTLAERRRFVMSGVSGKAVALVTTDTLMRGVDLPMVGHVIMYDAPTSVAQYVHRIGRTARALRAGHAYMLLSKKGPSGTLADGEVAKFKALDAFLSRSAPVIHEKALQQLTSEDVELAETKLKETQAALKKYFSHTNVANSKKVVVNEKRPRQ
jgi:superfamily II DNA/RNA helicase